MNKMLTPEDIRALPPSERLRLIEELWDSLDADGAEAVPMPEWHKAILDERLDALENGASHGRSWSDVRHRISGQE